MRKIFLAILEDRHIDNCYEASESLKEAIKTCERWIKGYQKGRYKFKAYATPIWPYAKTAGDDCPKVHVEMIDLNENKPYGER